MMSAITPVVYLKRVGDKYYVGETVDINHRYTESERQSIVAVAPASLITEERKAQELEAIEFCMAFGLPLSNVHKGNIRRAYAAFLKSGSNSIIDFFSHWDTSPENEFGK
jgi:hypothetical protein